MALVLTALFLFAGSGLMAQTVTYTWDPYKTKFSVPDNFRVLESTGDKWSGTNSDITLTIFPRTGENLAWDGMKSAVHSWAVSSGVINIGESTELAEDKLNGYWGVMYEGEKDGFPVATMLVVDPDYPDISLYIWVSYRVGFEDKVIDILMSFTPN